MAHDMLEFTKTFEEDFRQGSLKEFAPQLELVGSMTEGTRIGLANEVDLGIHFTAWQSRIPFQVEGDPFSLKKAKTCPSFMDEYFQGREFMYHKFLRVLLESVDQVVEQIFEEKRNPPNLKRVTSNKAWRKGDTKCKGACRAKMEANNFVQCPKCAVTVSQTKSGVALQFEWETKNDKGEMEKIYTSIDLIPIFPIKPIQAMKLARIIMTAMLGPNRRAPYPDPPQGWLSFLLKYMKDYKIVQEVIQIGRDEIISVGLKTMNFLNERNHHIKPAQAFTGDKFKSPRMKAIYSCIKFLKKALCLDLSSFWVKKELLREQYQSILEDSSDSDDRALVLVLSQPEFRSKTQNKIDFQESNRIGYICLKRDAVET